MLKKLKTYLRKHLNHSQILFIHKLRAIWANLRYGFPAHGMVVFGVTGTKGKTSTCHFLASIFDEAGLTTAMATTVNFKIADREWVNETNKSVLPPLQLQKLFREAKNAHCNVFILEITSHAIDQERIWGIPLKYVGLTNITHDHLDYHPTWEHYQKTKLRLFKHKEVKAMAVNGDDPSASLFLEETSAEKRWVYSLDQDPAFYQKATDHLFAHKISSYSSGSTFHLQTENEEVKVNLEMPGTFNIENALCATALALNLNIKLGTIVAGLEKMKRVPGRLEKIETKKGFSVMIDYAHTPDSLERLYLTLRPVVRGRMIAVLGSCGDRDRTKRPIMGALAARFCDFVLVTDEEPYTEDPNQIIEEVAKGVPRGRPLFKPNRPMNNHPILKKGDETGEGDWWWKIPDRRQAIEKAIGMGKLDDMIILTGMGAQNYKIVADQKVPWNDRHVVEEILQAKNLL